MSEATRDSEDSVPSVHRPVLLREVIRFLDLREGQTVVDGTIGAGGHSHKILKHIGPKGTLIGLDRDPMMLRLAAKPVSASNCFLHQASYADLGEVLRERKIQSVERILLDLGIASDQLADDARGFSFQSEGPLDLRFDTSSGQPAWQLIEQLSESELAEILQDYGEERFAGRIAKQLVARRAVGPVRTAADLADAVRQSVPKNFQRQAKKHPATRVFQALRIAVNDELNHLQTALDGTLYDALSSGGRLVVISFHSLEDRVVKAAFRGAQRWQNLTPKPVTATAVEQRMNPRCRTAKLRGAVKM